MADARVRSWISPCDTCGEQSGTEIFLRVHGFSTVHIIYIVLPIHSYYFGGGGIYGFI
jgi:hypothetical protein